MTEKQKLDEYLRRNLIHAKAVGVSAGLEYALDRLVAAKRAPKWLVKLLRTEFIKMAEVETEAARHRDEVKP